MFYIKFSLITFDAAFFNMFDPQTSYLGYNFRFTLDVTITFKIILLIILLLYIDTHTSLAYYIISNDGNYYYNFSIIYGPNIKKEKEIWVSDYSDWEWTVLGICHPR